MSIGKKTTLLLAFGLVITLISCNSNNDEIVEISFQVNNIGIVLDASAGRVEHFPTGFEQTLGGTGTLTVRDSESKVVQTKEIDGDELTTVSIELATGAYSFEYISDPPSCNVSTYFPFEAEAKNVLISSSQSVNLVGETDWDLILVSNQDLCNQTIGQTFSAVFYDLDGDGTINLDNCDLAVPLVGTHYNFYNNSAEDAEIPSLWIYYDDPNLENCGLEKINRETEGSHAFFYDIAIGQPDASSVEINGIFTTYKFDIGI